MRLPWRSPGEFRWIIKRMAFARSPLLMYNQGILGSTNAVHPTAWGRRCVPPDSPWNSRTRNLMRRVESCKCISEARHNWENVRNHVQKFCLNKSTLKPFYLKFEVTRCRCNSPFLSWFVLLLVFKSQFFLPPFIFASSSLSLFFFPWCENSFSHHLLVWALFIYITWTWYLIQRKTF